MPETNLSLWLPGIGGWLAASLPEQSLVMPYFTINFGSGHNVVNAQTEDLKGFYEILALKINIMHKTYLHIGYSLYDFYYPNNLMLGVGLHL